jgi:hypothetical protein
MSRESLKNAVAMLEEEQCKLASLITTMKKLLGVQRREQTEDVPKKRGRPSGSKNRPKVEVQP